MLSPLAEMMLVFENDPSVFENDSSGRLSGLEEKTQARSCPQSSGVLGWHPGYGHWNFYRRSKLPKALTVVRHGEHFVPMWLQSFGADVKSRPLLPLQSYDAYLDRFGPVARACDGWVDCTSMAAGDCGFHALLTLRHVQEDAAPVPVARDRPMKISKLGCLRSKIARLKLGGLSPEKEGS